MYFRTGSKDELRIHSRTSHISNTCTQHNRLSSSLFLYPLLYSMPRVDVVWIQTVHSRKVKFPLHCKGSGCDQLLSPRSTRFYPFSVAGLHGLSFPQHTATTQAPPTAPSTSDVDASHFSSPGTPCCKAWNCWDVCKLLSWNISLSAHIFSG